MLGRFFNYVELQTKITSFYTFFMALAYLSFLGGPLRLLPTAIFFCSMFLFDLATTAINNYIDSKTNGQTLPYTRPTALAIIVALLVISTALGLWLAWITDVVVLLVGMLCFVCGVLYTYGPVPISRQPLGELLSGVFYGVLIPFLILYINLPEWSLVHLTLNTQRISLDIEVVPMLQLLLVSVAPTMATANIMFANNICDRERDILVGRHTLAFYLKERSLDLFAWLYYSIYIAAIILVVAGVFPPLYLLLLLTLWPVHKNIQTFRKTQDKQVTFVLSVKNFVWIMAADVLLIAACAWL